jgi:hypothetical protein
MGIVSTVELHFGHFFAFLIFLSTSFLPIDPQTIPYNFISGYGTVDLTMKKPTFFHRNRIVHQPFSKTGSMSLLNNSHLPGLLPKEG